MTSKKVVIIIVGLLLCLTVLGGVAAILVYNGIVLLNNPSREQYPVRGVDVSHYQGDIDWSVLSNEGIDFAFIKATEGSTYIDEKCEYNLTNALKQDIFVGAYHFFSFESSGKTQAENFIANVPTVDGMLPPVIDLEFYGKFCDDPMNPRVVLPELNVLLAELEEYYGKKPIIYVTEGSYELYLQGGYEEYDIWIRDVIFEPKLSDGREWTFWQYTNRERLNGYNGQEKFIDMNVFCGSREEFLEYVK